jgi:hypothetical protein
MLVVRQAAPGAPLIAGRPRGGRSRHSARLFKLTESASRPRYVTARIALDPGNPALIYEGKGRTLRQQLDIILDPKNSLVDHLELAVSHQPCLEESLQHIGLPIDRKFKGKVLKGHGVIVGIIDDGCAFAHRHFLSDGGRRLGTRILSLWDQSQLPTPADAAKGGRFPLISNTAASSERRRSTDHQCEPVRHRSDRRRRGVRPFSLCARRP